MRCSCMEAEVGKEGREERQPNGGGNGHRGLDATPIELDLLASMVGSSVVDREAAVRVADSLPALIVTDVAEPSAAAGHEPLQLFACQYCRRQFYSVQALGGHQNAHKRERTLARYRGDEVDPLGAGLHVSGAPFAIHGAFVAAPALGWTHVTNGQAAGERRVAIVGYADRPVDGGEELPKVDLTLKL